MQSVKTLNRAPGNIRRSNQKVQEHARDNPLMPRTPKKSIAARHFDVTDPAWNNALIRAHSFAVMITADDSPSSRVVGLLPRCYQIIPNHADPSRPVSVLTVEIFAV